MFLSKSSKRIAYCHEIQCRTLSQKSFVNISSNQTKRNCRCITCVLKELMSDLTLMFILTTVTLFVDEMVTECPQDCHGHGDCVEGQCQCFPGYTSWDCSQSK